MASINTQRVSSSSSSSTHKWTHDVFLNFCGNDTRNSFTDHLFYALKQKGIAVFKDDEILERGKYISQELFKAIEASLYAITIISENYANSKWCLIELAKIVECMRETTLTILPVFYNVDPSDVRNQTGNFTIALASLEEDPEVDMEKLQKWRAALREVGRISGWHVHDRQESTIIIEISEQIFYGLSRNFSNISNKLVGIESRVEEMMKLLNIGSDDVRFIGIHGMGGVGKTTLAEVIYERVSYHFKARSFIACIREETRNRGLVSLQQQLLSKILMQREIHIWDDCEGTRMIKSTLQNRKVFIVLDDVDKEKHLAALAGSHDWFGPGSRIILTSRDSHLLKTHGVEGIYKVKELNIDEALQLFCISAFKKPYPEENYLKLSNAFVSYAQGLPLALKVLGSLLYGRPANAWKSVWHQLKVNPNRGIMDVLQIGFDGLEDLQKKLFLDIAFFFRGDVLDNILMDILQSCGYYPCFNIVVLMEKCFITISSGRLRMHDLLQKMGQEIVHRESPEEPGQRSRLWHCDDIIHVLKENTGTNAVEGIFLKLPSCKEKRLNVKAFSMMRNLRIVKFGNRSNYNVDIVKNFSKFHDKYLCSTLLPGDLLRSMPTNELRAMDWLGFPLKSLPTNFQSDHLVQLNMSCSRIKQLWKGIKSFGNLKRFDLSGSKSLMEIPDFTGVPNLEILDLEACTSLSKVHTSIGVLKRLRRLNLYGCKCLKTLPDKMSLESLEYLYLSGCSRLKKFPDIVGNMTSLRLLYLNETAIEELPQSFKALSSLFILSLRDCKKLSAVPSVICDLPSLKVLDVSGCSRLEGTSDFSCDFSCDQYLEKVFLGGTAIKFSKNFAIPEYGSNNARPIRGIEMISDDSIGAFYIGSCDRLYCARNFDEESDYFLQKKSTVLCASTMGPGLPEWCDIRSTDSCITIKIQEDSDDDNSKWYGYSQVFAYEAHERKKSNSRSFDSTHTDYDQFVEFVYQFETDEGLLKPPLVLRAPKDHSLGELRFGVYIPAKWFLERSNNLKGWTYIKASIETHSPDVEVRECGARLHYLHTGELYYQGHAQYGLDLVHYLSNIYWRTVTPAVEPLC